jgi:CheY-like chemotaxis protein
MPTTRKPVIILIADDDADDRQFTREALETSRLVNELHFVVDGEDLLDYLLRRGRYTAPGSAPRPGLILLDLNMPKMDGRQALREIKTDPALRHIPIVILTTSRADEDIVRAYDLGANSFVSKPVTFAGLSEAMKAITHYWFEIVELPSAS